MSLRIRFHNGRGSVAHYRGPAGGAACPPQLAGSQILNVGVCPEPHVIGEVPAHVIRIVVNHDLVGIPKPASTEADIEGSHVEIESAEPEASRNAACQPPNMPLANAAGEVSMFPRMIKMVMRIVFAGVVSHPLAVGMDVGRLRMPGLVGNGMIGPRRGVPRLYGSRSTLGNVSATHLRLAASVFFLRENWESQRQRNCAQPDKYLHSTTSK